MNKILIFGKSGFVGKNLINYLTTNLTNYTISKDDILVDCVHTVINLVGKAHYTRNNLSSQEYYNVNTTLSKQYFDNFLLSKAKIYISISSVKAVSDGNIDELTEDTLANPHTHYGKSKLLAEQYILSKTIPQDKRVFILRPCMIHGPENKGNLNLLYKFATKGFPWPLGYYSNNRSYCSIDNICFILKELIENDSIESGVYNISDDDVISTNDLIKLIAISQNKKAIIWNVPKFFIRIFSSFGDLFRLPLNSDSLSKLTDSYVVSNRKIKKAIKKPLPLSTTEGLMKTFQSFNN